MDKVLTEPEEENTCTCIWDNKDVCHAYQASAVLLHVYAERCLPLLLFLPDDAPPPPEGIVEEVTGSGGLLDPEAV